MHTPNIWHENPDSRCRVQDASLPAALRVVLQEGTSQARTETAPTETTRTTTRRRSFRLPRARHKP